MLACFSRVGMALDLLASGLRTADLARLEAVQHMFRRTRPTPDPSCFVPPTFSLGWVDLEEKVFRGG